MKELFISICTLVLLAGCISDDRENFMVDDSFTLTNRQTLVGCSVHTGSYTVGVSKNGKGKSAAIATLSTSAADAIASYNEVNGTSFSALPEGSFTLSAQSLEFAESDVVKEVTVTWDADKIAGIIGDSKDYVIPIRITSGGGIEANPDKSLVIIQLIRSSVRVMQSNLSRSISRKSVEPDNDGRQPALQESITLDLENSNPIKGVSMEFPLLIDDSLIAAYNKENELEAQPVPREIMHLESDSVCIPEGSKSASFKLAFDKSHFLGPDGKIQAFPDYLVPVRVNAEAVKATYKEKDFAVKGLDFGNLVTYILIHYQKSTGGVIITREWGKYSSESGSWSDFMDGFTAGSERNVAIDDDFIYLAETNKTKNIWAISISNPQNYRKLPVGTVEESGIFYASCPRIIANTDPAINDGKDVLVVSSMTEGDPMLYVYNKGINADPLAIKLVTWAGRRLGDTFTYWGNLQNGVLFFKDFNTAQGTVTFPVKGIPANSMFYLAGRIVAPAVTGAGAYFPFPDNVNAGPCSVRGGKESWMVKASKDLMKLEGADSAPVLTPMSGYYADAAFRFFEFNGKRYIAYSRQVSSTDGRVFIIDGAATDSWENILEKRNVIYQAAIQEEGEMQEEYKECPKGSGNSGMDIDVRLAGGDAYIAVVKQNVGLSLFKMTLD